MRAAVASVRTVLSAATGSRAVTVPRTCTSPGGHHRHGSAFEQIAQRHHLQIAPLHGLGRSEQLDRASDAQVGATEDLHGPRASIDLDRHSGRDVHRQERECRAATRDDLPISAIERLAGAQRRVALRPEDAEAAVARLDPDARPHDSRAHFESGDRGIASTKAPSSRGSLATPRGRGSNLPTTDQCHGDAGSDVLPH
jgi:hypothetical protein